MVWFGLVWWLQFPPPWFRGKAWCSWQSQANCSEPDDWEQPSNRRRTTYHWGNENGKQKTRYLVGNINSFLLNYKIFFVLSCFILIDYFWLNIYLTPHLPGVCGQSYRAPLKAANKIFTKCQKCKKIEPLADLRHHCLLKNHSPSFWLRLSAWKAISKKLWY